MSAKKKAHAPYLAIQLCILRTSYCQKVWRIYSLGLKMLILAGLFKHNERLLIAVLSTTFIESTHRIQKGQSIMELLVLVVAQAQENFFLFALLTPLETIMASNVIYSKSEKAVFIFKRKPRTCTVICFEKCYGLLLLQDGCRFKMCKIKQFCNIMMK